MPKVKVENSVKGLKGFQEVEPYKLKDAQLKVRCTKHLKDLIHDVCEDLDLSTGEFIRGAIIDKLKALDKYEKQTKGVPENQLRLYDKGKH